jgi:N-acetylglucosamine-6-phosphate deacetylase
MKILTQRLFANNQVVKNQLIITDNDQVVSVEDYQGQTVDVTYDNLAAGLFDTHING